MVPRQEKEITPEESFRAVYLDFESLVKEPPALLGWACEFHFEQIVLDEQLELAADERSLRIRSLSHTINDLLSKCRDEQRVLVGYSQAEKMTIAEETRFSAADVYRDSKAIAKRWINRLHPEEKLSGGNWKLRHLLDLMGFPWPSYLGYQSVGRRIRNVTKQATKKDTYEDFSKSGKKDWTILLDYNRIDTLGMRDLTMRAAAELAVAEEHRIFVRS